MITRRRFNLVPTALIGKNLRELSDPSHSSLGPRAIAHTDFAEQAPDPRSL